MRARLYEECHVLQIYLRGIAGRVIFCLPVILLFETYEIVPRTASVIIVRIGGDQPTDSYSCVALQVGQIRDRMQRIDLFLSPHYDP